MMLYLVCVNGYGSAIGLRNFNETYCFGNYQKTKIMA